MSNNYRKRSGDRPDGRRIRSLNGFFNFIPYIMPQRNDACNQYEESFEISNADRWFRQQRLNGYKGIGMLHLFIAAYVRAIAALPGLNRFVVGRRIYARNSIEVVLTVKRSLTVDATETTIKVEFDPTDTIFDVYRKMNEEIDKIKSSDEENGTEDFANKFKNLPRFVVRFVIWLLTVADYFGLLPKSLLDVSPFHGSMIITDLGSLGIGPIYHHIYNFGTLPVFISFGAKRKVYELDRNGNPVERKYVDGKFVMDERTVDGHYYATVFKYINRFIADPSLLEVPPEKVVQDIF
ncbi:MAG: hypothetical protein PUC58_02275 [Oscillospiraceae bacterium]|nr:hypothetical protein [Oscillospiraceae bacterium]